MVAGVCVLRIFKSLFRGIRRTQTLPLAVLVPWLIAVPAAHADWIASGTALYVHRDYHPVGGDGPAANRPIRWARVLVRDTNTWDTLAQGMTDDTGQFRILVPDSLVRDVAFVVLALPADTLRYPVVVLSSGYPLDLPWSVGSETFSHHGPTQDTQSYAPLSAASERIAGAFALLDNAERALDCAASTLGPLRPAFNMPLLWNCGLGPLRATVGRGEVDLQWLSYLAGERQFDVQRATATGNFASVGTAQGLSGVEQVYRDTTVASGQAYSHLIGSRLDPDEPWSFTNLMSVLTPGSLFSLRPPAPNPMRDRTRIDFEVAVAGRVRLTLHDVSGRLRRTLMDEVRHPGPVTRTWDGLDQDGRQVASGVYFVRLTTAGESATRKILFVR